MKEFQHSHGLSRVEINVQLASESSFLMKQIQKQIVSLKSLEVYPSIDIEYMGVVTKEST